MHFDQKKYTTNYKMRLIQNKEDMISYYQLKKLKKKQQRPKNYVNVVKNEKKFKKI